MSSQSQYQPSSNDPSSSVDTTAARSQNRQSNINNDVLSILNLHAPGTDEHERIIGVVPRNLARAVYIKKGWDASRFDQEPIGPWPVIGNQPARADRVSAIPSSISRIPDSQASAARQHHHLYDDEVYSVPSDHTFRGDQEEETQDYNERISSIRDDQNFDERKSTAGDHQATFEASDQGFAVAGDEHDATESVMDDGELEAGEDLMRYANPFELSIDDWVEIAAATQGESIDTVRTRYTQTYGQTQFTATPRMPHHLTQALDPSGLRNRDESARQFREALQQGIMPFIRLVCQHELSCTTLHGAKLNDVLDDAYTFYITVQPEIAAALLEGDLPRKYANPQSVERRLIDQNRERAETTAHPGIYMQALIDQDGQSPTVQDLRDALDDFHTYCFDRDNEAEAYAEWVDEYKAPGTSMANIRRGVRKYLRNNEELPIKTRLDSAGTFHKYLSAALAAVPAQDHDKPFSRYLVEFGFSCRLLDRLKQHRDHKGSNHLMNLFEACLARRCPDKGYHLGQYIVYLCSRPSDAALGEIILTRLGQGYVTSGTGFSHYPAGRSVPLGRRTIQQWAEYHRWVMENTATVEVHRREIEMISKESPSWEDLAAAVAEFRPHPRAEMLLAVARQLGFIQ